MKNSLIKLNDYKFDVNKARNKFIVGFDIFITSIYPNKPHSAVDGLSDDDMRIIHPGEVGLITKIEDLNQSDYRYNLGFEIEVDYGDTLASYTELFLKNGYYSIPEHNGMLPVLDSFEDLFLFSRLRRKKPNRLAHTYALGHAPSV